MSKKVINKSLTKKKVNKFDTGSWKQNWQGANLGGAISTTVGGAANVATNAISLANSGDSSKLDNTLNQQQAKLDALQFQKYTASNRAELLNQMQNTQFADTSDFEETMSLVDAGGPTGGDWATGIISGAAAGAAAGSMIAPPWGTIGGIIVGAGAAAAGLGARQANAKLDLKEFELEQERNKAEAEITNNNIREAAVNQNNQIAQRELTDFRLANINADGGPIHIKKSKVGTFTAAAEHRGLGVQEFANKVIAHPENYTEAMRRKAQFAHNAARFKHSYGGPLYNLSGDFTNGLVFIDEGGTHEQNPMEGVMVGVDNEGTPNLVEEGEIIFNDYVFSNRLKPTKKILEDGGFKPIYENWTFAKIAEDLQRESSERPNDIISINTLNDNMNRLITLQEQIREKKKTNSYKCGGKVNKYLPGGDLDNYSYMPENVYYEYLMKNPAYTKFSNSINTSLDVPTFKRPAIYSDSNFAAKNSRNNSTVKMVDIDFNNVGPKLEDHSQVIDISEDLVDGFEYEDIVVPDIKKNSKYEFLNNAGRYFPALTNLTSAIVNASQDPKKDFMDYSHLDNAFDYYKGIPTVTYNPIGGKKVFKPSDSSLVTNQILADAAANRRAVGEAATTASQKAGLLASMNPKVAAGLAAAEQQFKDADFARDMQVGQFNLGIDTANTQGSMQAQTANQQRGSIIANAAANMAAQKIGIDQYNKALLDKHSQAVSGSVGALSNDIAGIATENYWRNVIKDNPVYAEMLAKSGMKVANGGMLTRKKRRK